MSIRKDTDRAGQDAPRDLAREKYEHILGLARLTLLAAAKMGAPADEIVLQALADARNDTWGARKKRIVPLSRQAQTALSAELLKTCGELFDEAHVLHVQRAVDAFLMEETRAAAMPKETPVFGDDLAAIIRPALAKLELLNDAGAFIGKPYHVKALFLVLIKRGYISSKAKRIENAFSDFFHAYFDFRVADRTLRNKPSRGQDEAETDFDLRIPRKL